MIGRRIYVCSTKYDGAPHWQFDSWFVHEDGPLLITSNFAGQELTTSDGPWTTPYDDRNHFWQDRWYNVIRMDLPQGGGLYGWYCNVTTPAQYDGETVRYADLDLDVWVPPEGEPEVLDEDEFAENAARMRYPDDVLREARRAVEELLGLARAGDFPFVRD
jgi:protein associated with RNAse G/E